MLQQGKNPALGAGNGDGQWPPSTGWGGDDGGWSQGAPTEGSGWMEQGSSSAEENSHDIGTWQNPANAGGDWQHSSNIIVDRNDKEAWPSIGDNSESTSDNGDDNASVNSGSVISSSSNQGQSQGQEASQGSSAMQSQSASSFWGANSNFNGLESNSWGIGIGTSGSSAASIWGNSNPSLSVNSQGHNMQSGVSPAGGDATNPLNSSPRLGWGTSIPGTLPSASPSQIQGNGDRPQTSMQMSQSVESNNIMPQSVGSGGIMPQTVGSGSIMQTSLTISAGQISGPPQVSCHGSAVSHISGQGNSLVSGFPKPTESSWGTGLIGRETPDTAKSDGNALKPELQTMVEGTKSASAAWGNPNPNQNPNPHAGSSWATPPTSTPQQWGSPASAPGQPIPQRWGNGNSGASSAVGMTPPKNQPNTWAQAAGKGLESSADVSKPPQSTQTVVIDNEILQAVECHEGWGQRNICQDTEWNIDTSPKSQRKCSNNDKNSNVWNNNNGTAIWEANKASSAWNASKNTSGAASWDGEKEGSSWGAAGQKVNPREAQGTSWGAVRGEQPNPNWEKKTETGSWREQHDESSGISTWGEGEPKTRWNDGTCKQNIDGTAHWGMPGTQCKPKSWNSTVPPPVVPPPPPPPKMDEPWKQKPPGWTDQGPPPSQRHSEWSGPQQVRSEGTPPWNVDVGPNQKPNWQDDGSMVWNQDRKEDQVWNDDGSGSLDNDMGLWNDGVQEGSLWSSAPRKLNRNNIMKSSDIFQPGSKYPPVSQPQMRVRLLQQLMDAGFKKDEAQAALIKNDMNLHNALADLYKLQGANKKDSEVDIFNSESGKKYSGMLTDCAPDDISDIQSENNPLVPQIQNMQNTPYHNAQSQLQSQFIGSPFNKGPSLPQPSLNPNTPSINSLQHKMIQHKFQQQQINSINPPGPIGRGPIQGTVPGPAPPGLGPGPSTGPAPGPGPGHLMQQQMAQQQMAQQQQQILQQLRMAVQAGLISPQLLNRQLPPQTLMLLQQMLQYQQTLHSLITTQQVLTQNKTNLNPVLQKQQLDKVALQINSIKQQMLMLQKRIAAADAKVTKPSQEDSVPALQSEIGNLNISASQSRLVHWKQQTRENDSILEQNASNKAVGSKSIHQSNSTQNLAGLGNLGGDPTWGTTTTSSSQNWPNLTSTSTTNHIEMEEPSESKESPAISSTVSLNDSIPEFIPGKPWQGNLKSVEDDPHITPGSFSMARSLSVNTVKDDYLNNLTALTKTSPTVPDSSSTWSVKDFPRTSTAPTQSLPNKPWSTSETIAPTSFTSEVWGVPLPKNSPALTRPPPPGLPNKIGWTGTNRQHSWTGARTDNSAFVQVGTTNWEGHVANPSTFLLLRNLTPQIDGSTLRTLCQQHGPLTWFHLSLNHGQALVQYNSKEEAIKAQKSLHTCILGNTTIVAEFVPDHEAVRLIEQQQNAISTSQWSQHTSQNNYRQPGSRIEANNNWNTGIHMTPAPTPTPAAVTYSNFPGNSMWSSPSTSLWGGMDDHGSNNLLGNMLGESM